MSGLFGMYGIIFAATVTTALFVPPERLPKEGVKDEQLDVRELRFDDERRGGTP